MQSYSLEIFVLFAVLVIKKKIDSATNTYLKGNICDRFGQIIRFH